MAEILWSFAVQEVLKKIGKLAAEQIGLAWGFKKELSKLKDSLLMVEAILHDVDRIKAEHQAVKLWVDKLEDIVFEADVILDKLAFEDLRRKVGITGKEAMVSYFVSSSKNLLVFRLKMANKIKAVAKALHEHYRAASAVGLVALTSKEIESELSQIQETDSFLDENIEVVGREFEVNEIVNKLIDLSSEEALCVLPIVGEGGLGKTLVAKVLFNHQVIRENFDTTIWVYVSSKPFVIKKILKAILETLNANFGGLDSKEAILQELKKLLNEKKYFLVLDDVWNVNPSLWNELKGCLLKINKRFDSAIVVTTRSDEVAHITETSYYSRYHLRKLSNEDSWYLFKKCIFISELPKITFELNKVQEELLEKFGGIPLVVKVLGGMVKLDKNHEDHQWESTLKSLLRISLQDENHVLSTIKLGVDRLPSSSLKHSFTSGSNSFQDLKFKKE